MRYYLQGSSHADPCDHGCPGGRAGLGHRRHRQTADAMAERWEGRRTVARAGHHRPHSLGRVAVCERKRADRQGGSADGRFAGRNDQAGSRTSSPATPAAAAPSSPAAAGPAASPAAAPSPPAAAASPAAAPAAAALARACRAIRAARRPARGPRERGRERVRVGSAEGAGRGPLTLTHARTAHAGRDPRSEHATAHGHPCRPALGRKVSRSS
jgi:hypothetical protein